MKQTKALVSILSNIIAIFSYSEVSIENKAISRVRFFNSMNKTFLHLSQLYISALLTLFLFSNNANAADKFLFVNGYINVPVEVKRGKPKDIALPNAKVYLHLFGDKTPVASTISDLSGRFVLKTNIRGVFQLCVEADGFPKHCASNEFSLIKKSHRYGDFRLTLPKFSQKRATVFGTIEFKDGSTPRAFQPIMGVNAFAEVSLHEEKKKTYHAYLNNMGEYIIPSVPAGRDFTLKVHSGDEIINRFIDARSNLQTNNHYAIDFTLANTPPEIRLLSSKVDDKIVQQVQAGNTVIIKAVANDIDKDKLIYRWLLPSGKLLEPTSESSIKWRAPSKKGSYNFTVLVDDSRGAYVKRSLHLVVGDNRTPFNGIIVDSNDKPISGAQVNLNGRITQSNANGHFKIRVPIKDRYVMTIRKDGVSTVDKNGYGTASFVYNNNIIGGRWVLRSAEVFVVDPSQPIILRQSAKTRDCIAPKTERIHWRPFLNPKLLQWQNGQGKILSIAEQAQKKESRESFKRVLPLLSNLNSDLPSVLLNASNLFKTNNKDTNTSLKKTVVKPSRLDSFPQKLSHLDFPVFLDPKVDWSKLNLGDTNSNKVKNKLTGEFKEILSRLNERDHRKKEISCGNGIGVQIPANALVDRNGNSPTGKVRIALSSIEVNASQMPGDLSAKDENGNPVYMESFGAGSIEIGDGRKKFNLAPTKTAEIIIPIDRSQRIGNASPEAKIPFLYFNTATGGWEQSGFAKLSGNGANQVYTKKVAHFSTLNADILKTDQSCVAVEVDSTAGFTFPLQVEVTMQPSVVNPDVIQVRTLSIPNNQGELIYNLPNNLDIALTPIINGVKPDGSAGLVPAGVFIVNTGGPQTPTNPNRPAANADGSYYAEDASGSPTGPCGSRVVLTNLVAPEPLEGYEFLQGLYFQSTNITELQNTSQVAIADTIINGAEDYYTHADPRNFRSTLNLFLQKNRFGQPLAANELEYDVEFANSGDLGFGRNMHCRRNVASDGTFDYACHVANHGQPPDDFADQLDANNVHDGIDQDATVAMEYSRVETPLIEPIEFPDNQRAVKFYVYGPDPDGPLITKADLDNFGERPVPQLCMVCHGGDLASVAADPLDPDGPKKGAFSDRADIMSMGSSFIPFDLSLYNFPAANSRATQEAAFKGLNIDIVKGVASATEAAGNEGAEIVELIDAFYAGGSATQIDEPVIAGWGGANPSSDTNKFYQKVYAPACRTCHLTKPFNSVLMKDAAEFDSLISTIQTRVCIQKIMPHAKRTHEVFWTSLDPNMPSFLELYGQSKSGWNSDPSSQCGQFYQAGGNVVSSVFSDEVYPLLNARCSSCHSVSGIASSTSFIIGNTTDTYSNLISNALITPNNPSASPLYQRLLGNGGVLMPQGGPALNNTDLNIILDWVNTGATGP